MRRLGEIVVRLQQDTGSPRQQIEPAAHIGDVLATGVDHKIRARTRIVERVHIAGHRTEALASRPVESRATGSTAASMSMLSTAPMSKRGSSNSIAASTPYQPPKTQMCCESSAAAFEQAVARPHLAGDLLVIEGVGDVGLGVLGDDARHPGNQRAAGVGGNAPREVEGVFPPILLRGVQLCSVIHFRLVCWPGRHNACLHQP